MAGLLNDVNISLDAIFFTLYPIVALALGVHFFFNIITGRAYRRFVKWEWPHHTASIPFTPKFLHFQHVAMMFLLGFSGMYIRFPFFDGGRSPMRWVHYFAMVVVTINLFWRLWYAFSSRQRDYREFAITGRDIRALFAVVGYYIFVRKTKPHLGKYNIMQKSVYIMFAPMLMLQALTGFSLLTVPLPFIGFTPRELLVGWWLGPLVGGTALAGAWARLAHYLLNWLFIVFTTIHIYLSITEDGAAFLRFFGLGWIDEARARRAGIQHEAEQPEQRVGAHRAPAMSRVMR